MSSTEKVPTLESALKLGRHATSILEAPPADLAAGYTDDEIAAQYAAVDQLVSAFHQIEALFST